MREPGPMRDALSSSLRDVERRLRALEQREVPAVYAAAADRSAAWFKAATGGVVSIAHNTAVTVAWSSAMIVGVGGFTPVADATGVALPAGVWWFEAWVRYDANATGQRHNFPLIDGASSSRRVVVDAAASGFTELQAGVVVVSTGGTRVGVQMFQTSGVTLATCEARIGAVKVGDTP